MTVHDRLIARQPTDELRRKQIKARRRSIWTQEDVDRANREADEICSKLRFE